MIYKMKVCPNNAYFYKDYASFCLFLLPSLYFISTKELNLPKYCTETISQPEFKNLSVKHLNRNFLDIKILFFYCWFLMQVALFILFTSCEGKTNILVHSVVSFFPLILCRVCLLQSIIVYFHASEDCLFVCQYIPIVCVVVWKCRYF